MISLSNWMWQFRDQIETWEKISFLKVSSLTRGAHISRELELLGFGSLISDKWAFFVLNYPPA